MPIRDEKYLFQNIHIGYYRETYTRTSKYVQGRTKTFKKVQGRARTYKNVERRTYFTLYMYLMGVKGCTLYKDEQGRTPS